MLFTNVRLICDDVDEKLSSVEWMRTSDDETRDVAAKQCHQGCRAGAKPVRQDKSSIR